MSELLKWRPNLTLGLWLGFTFLELVYNFDVRSQHLALWAGLSVVVSFVVDVWVVSRNVLIGVTDVADAAQSHHLNISSPNKYEY